jgi:hypothetical protein
MSATVPDRFSAPAQPVLSVRGMARRHHWTRPVPEVGWRRMPSPAGAGEGPGTASGRRPPGGAVRLVPPLRKTPAPGLARRALRPRGRQRRQILLHIRPRQAPLAHRRGAKGRHGLHQRRDRQRPAIGKAQAVRPAVHIRPPVTSTIRSVALRATTRSRALATGARPRPGPLQRVPARTGAAQGLATDGADVGTTLSGAASGNPSPRAVTAAAK